jgi:hypothetical protein
MNFFTQVGNHGAHQLQSPIVPSTGNSFCSEYIWPLVEAIWLRFTHFLMMLSPFYNRAVAVLSLLFTLSIAQDPACTAVVVSQSLPSTGAGVSLQSFSYCGGNLIATAYVEVRLLLAEN